MKKFWREIKIFPLLLTCSVPYKDGAVVIYFSLLYLLLSMDCHGIQASYQLCLLRFIYCCILLYIAEVTCGYEQHHEQIWRHLIQVVSEGEEDWIKYWMCCDAGGSMATVLCNHQVYLNFTRLKIFVTINLMCGREGKKKERRRKGENGNVCKWHLIIHNVRTWSLKCWTDSSCFLSEWNSQS